MLPVPVFTAIPEIGGLPSSIARYPVAPPPGMYVKIHVSPEKRLKMPIPRFNPNQIPKAPNAAVKELFDTEPIARLMFHRLLRVPERRRVRVGLVVGTTDRLTSFLEAQGMSVVRRVRTLRASDTADLDLLLVDLVSSPSIRRPELVAFLHRGGCMFLTGLIPETADQLDRGSLGVTARSKPAHVGHRVAELRHRLLGEQLIIQRMRPTVAT